MVLHMLYIGSDRTMYMDVYVYVHACTCIRAQCTYILDRQLYYAVELHV